jgi:signal transduction histidine kinase
MRRPSAEAKPDERAAVEGPAPGREVPVRDLDREREERFRAIADLTHRFLDVAPGALAACMREGLATVARIAGAERAQLVLLKPGDPPIVRHFQWCAERMPRLFAIDDGPATASRFQWAAQRFLAGETIQLRRLSDLPAEAVAERELFASQGITSYLGIPIHHEGRVVGFLDVARRARAGEGWSDDEIARLHLVAEIFSATVRRIDLEHELARQLEVEKRVGHISRSLLGHGADEIDAGLARGLEAAAAYVAADRAYVVAAADDGPTPAVYDWRADAVPPRPHRTGLAERASQQWILERLQRGEVVRIPRIEDVPAEAAAWRDVMLADGLLSYLCIPIRWDGRLQGALGFHWLARRARVGEGDLVVLRLIGELFAGMLRRKRAEQRLKESQQTLAQAQKMEALGTLAGGIAHDFNNQLTVMLANARYAMRRLPEDDEVGRALADLHRAAQHCAQLTKGLLAFSRRTPASPRPLDVSAVLAEVEDLLRPLIPTSIELRIVDAHAGARIVADPVQLQQVIVNLVVNARDAMPDGGHLVLGVSRRELAGSEALALGVSPGAYVAIEVADTGTGIDPAVRARIFEPFFTTKEPGKGTGLGLATAYGIVQECRGAIAVDSEPGQGATFRVLLPESRADADEDGAEKDEPARGGRGAVLVVEDDEGVRRALARALREGGYEVAEAGDGLEALARLAAGRFEALVTDVDVPRLGGIDLARRLAAAGSPPPTLFVSGAAVEQLGGPEGPVPRFGFLAKPFSDAALLDALHGLLAD